MYSLCDFYVEKNKIIKAQLGDVSTCHYSQILDHKLNIGGDNAFEEERFN